jgi:hypothetical protein
MANHRAIKTVCESVLSLLKSNYQASDFNNTQLQFEVFLAKDFTTGTGLNVGVSLFLYRVYVNTSHRTPSGRVGPSGERYQTQLPLDLHFLLTAWGEEASMQHTITGWMMRVLEDHPILPPGLLNSLDPGVFHPDETVEICLTELKNEDMMSIWRDMVEKKYQLSIPYMARNIRIESDWELVSGAPVQRRTGDYKFEADWKKDEG